MLEPNGITLGAEPDFARDLRRFNNLHVRVSIKGTNPEEYASLTGAIPESYALPYKGLKHLIDAGVSCNACLSASFSTDEGIEDAKEQLYAVHPGILKSLEIEHITLFPKVAKRLSEAGLIPKPVRHKGRIVHLDRDRRPNC